LLTFVTCFVLDSERPSFESLLFSFGVGLGVLFGSGPHKLEAQRLRQLLEETQANLETLNLELARRKSPGRTNVLDSTTVSGALP
jgi:hypothetical protein